MSNLKSPDGQMRLDLLMVRFTMVRASCFESIVEYICVYMFLFLVLLRNRFRVYLLYAYLFICLYLIRPLNFLLWI